MKIAILSDTHCHHNEVKVPEADVLIHCGDWTNGGQVPEFHSFLNWFSSQPHKYKIFISGNHERGLDRYPYRTKRLEIISSYTNKTPNMYYLENNSITIDGVKFYGSPYTPLFGYDWAWNISRGSEIADKWDDIPNDTNVLITHGPPYKVLDNVILRFGELRDPHQGCMDLYNKTQELKQLKAHLFGHLHLQGGNTLYHNGITYVNAAICDDGHQSIRSAPVISI